MIRKNLKEIRKPERKECAVRAFRVNTKIPLLEFLLTNINQSRNNVKTILSKRNVLVDGAVVTQFDYLLQPEQIVTVTRSPVINQAKNDVKLDIVYEDKEIIVINKPSGLLSIATDNENSQTAYRQMMDYVRQEDKKNRVYVVHRIDRDTSGILMFVKSEQLQQLWQDKWNSLVSLREYIAVVDGNLKEKVGTLQSWLKETSTHVMYSSPVKGKGLLSTTHYKVIKENKQHSLLEVKIDSGRKNQIRVHLFEHGNPVVGDSKYGKPTNPLKRLGLHASALKIKHPVTFKEYVFKAPIPPSFTNLFKAKKD